MCVFVIRVHIGAPDFWKLPCLTLGAGPRSLLRLLGLILESSEIYRMMTDKFM